MGRGRTWTEDEKELFEAMLASGATDKQVAARMGRTVMAVQSRRHRLGITVRRVVDMTPERIAAIELARERGWSWKKIGDKLGWAPWTLSRRYKQAKGAKL